MITPLGPKSHRRRQRITPAKQSAPPPVVNSILHVRRTDEENVFDVELNHPLVVAIDAGGMFEVSIDGSTWTAATGVEFSAESLIVQFSFNQSMLDATMWRVPSPDDWVFAASAPLDAPYSGTIEEA